MFPLCKYSECSITHPSVHPPSLQDDRMNILGAVKLSRKNTITEAILPSLGFLTSVLMLVTFCPTITPVV